MRSDRSRQRGLGSRVIALLSAVLLASLVGGVTQAKPSTSIGPASARPDIIVIMLDDIAADVVPQLLDRLPALRSTFVTHGVRFPNAFGQDPLCCPGRANFLTGLTSRNHHVVTNDARLLDPRMTIATALHDAGYFTMVAGKYLNGVELLRDRTPPGWDRVAISSGGYEHWRLYRQGVSSYHGGAAADYSTDVFANQSIHWLKEAPGDRPRFLWLTPYATHGDPLTGDRLPRAAPRHRGDARCDEAGYRRTPAWDEADVSDRAAWVQGLPRLWSVDGVSRKGWPLRPICESLLSVDEWFRRVVAVQARDGRLDRTLFVLTGDNGMSWGDHRQLGKNVSWATPIPLYLSWRGTLGTGSATNQAFVMNIDLAPTFAELGKASLGPYPDGPSRPDGRSLVPTILAGSATSLLRTSLFEEHREPRLPRLAWSALRTTSSHPCGQWHYVEWDGGDRELFDLVNDPWELTNVVTSHEAVVRTLASELDLRKRGRAVTATACDP